MTIMNRLTEKVKETKVFSIDTESEVRGGEEQGALIQIECIHSLQQSTVILIETCYLPEEQWDLFLKMKELWSIIMKNTNKILTWGEQDSEMKNFKSFGLFEMNFPKDSANVQQLFQRWHNGDKMHPKTGGSHTPGEHEGWEQRTSSEACDCGHHTHWNPNTTWSLQDAIASMFGQFLNKAETVNKWGCGLDFDLGTWKDRLFSRKRYNLEEEQHKREQMRDYAVKDCTAVTKLYFSMYLEETRRLSSFETPSTENTAAIAGDEFSDISEEDLVQPLPFLSPPEVTVAETIDFHLFDNHSVEEMMDMYLFQEQSTEEFKDLMWSNGQPGPEASNDIVGQETTRQDQPCPTERTARAEKQRKENKKLKWKQQNNPHVQHKIRRPIYHRYDYRKIRSQLCDGDVHTSHQVTINRKIGEVSIGFKSVAEKERATRIMKVNYFSRDQY